MKGTTEQDIKEIEEQDMEECQQKQTKQVAKCQHSVIGYLALCSVVIRVLMGLFFYLIYSSVNKCEDGSCYHFTVQLFDSSMCHIISNFDKTSVISTAIGPSIGASATANIAEITLDDDARACGIVSLTWLEDVLGKVDLLRENALGDSCNHGFDLSGVTVVNRCKIPYDKNTFKGGAAVSGGWMDNQNFWTIVAALLLPMLVRLKQCYSAFFPSEHEGKQLKIEDLREDAWCKSCIVKFSKINHWIMSGAVLVILTALPTAVLAPINEVSTFETSHGELMMIPIDADYLENLSLAFIIMVSCIIAPPLVLLSINICCAPCLFCIMKGQEQDKKGEEKQEKQSSGVVFFGTVILVGYSFIFLLGGLTLIVLRLLGTNFTLAFAFSFNFSFKLAMYGDMVKALILIMWVNDLVDGTIKEVRKWKNRVRRMQ